MKFYAYILTIYIAVFLSSCVDQQSGPCASSLPLLTHNESKSVLILDVPADLNDFQLGNPLFIVAENISETRIQIIPDNDLKLFSLQGESWTPLENKVDYLGSIEPITPKSVSDPGSRIYYVEPDISNQSESVRVCIVLQGIMDDGGSQTKVMGFTEVTLNP